MNLTSHTIFITGGTSGIGLALAKAFADLGNKVIICGRTPEKLKTALECDSRLSGFTVDITDIEASSHILNEFARNNWHPSILINNAGIASSGKFLVDDKNYLNEHISRQIKTNLEAPMRLCVEFLPLLRKHKEAAIINVTSGLAITPTGSSAVYCASKAALRSFTKSLRYQMEYAGENIKVVEILPPISDTDMASRSNSYKMPSEQVAREVINGLMRGVNEIRIGKVRLLYMINRISPWLADKLMKSGWW